MCLIMASIRGCNVHGNLFCDILNFLNCCVVLSKEGKVASCRSGHGEHSTINIRARQQLQRQRKRCLGRDFIRGKARRGRRCETSTGEDAFLNIELYQKLHDL